jgi:hypothetical protein
MQQFLSYTQEANASVLIELGGVAEALYDRVVIAGEARLDGALDVALLDGFMPKAGDEFRILSYGSVQGSFSSIAGLGIGNGMYLEFSQDDTGITLVARQRAEEVTLTLGEANQDVRLETFGDRGTTFLSLQSASGAMLRTVVPLPAARVIDWTPSPSAISTWGPPRSKCVPRRSRCRGTRTSLPRPTSSSRPRLSARRRPGSPGSTWRFPPAW